MIYFASSQRNDLSGAHDYYDLWVFDQCHSTNDDSSIMGAAEAGTSVFNNNLLKILDGQECRVESKDSTLFQKTRNVPIVMIGNQLPNCIKENGPFHARFHRMPFFTNIYDLREERVIATLNGCIRRRLGLC